MEVGIVQYEYGMKEWVGNQRCIIRSACRGTNALLHIVALLMTYCLRVTSTLFTADARFVLSGSDDGNVRIWKARAAEKLGVVTTREKAAIEYRDSLRERWKFDKEVSKVTR